MRRKEVTGMPDDYIERIDALKAFAHAMPDTIDVWADQVGFSRANAETIIKAVPAADVEPVVRCRDCRFSHMTYDGECKYCDCFANKDENGELDETLYLPGDFFCAYGERKDKDAEVY